MHTYTNYRVLKAYIETLHCLRDGGNPSFSVRRESDLRMTAFLVFVNVLVVSYGQPRISALAMFSFGEQTARRHAKSLLSFRQNDAEFCRRQVWRWHLLKQLCNSG